MNSSTSDHHLPLASCLCSLPFTPFFQVLLDFARYSQCLLGNWDFAGIVLAGVVSSKMPLGSRPAGRSCSRGIFFSAISLIPSPTIPPMSLIFADRREKRSPSFASRPGAVLPLRSSCFPSPDKLLLIRRRSCHPRGDVLATLEGTFLTPPLGLKRL